MGKDCVDMMTDFSTMTDDQLDEWLAVKVMGWTLDGDLYFYPDGHQVETQDEMPMQKEDWQPTTDLNQAVMCAEKCRYIDIVKLPDRREWRVTIDLNDDENYTEGVNEQLSRALCKAIAMAVEGEG